MSRKTGGMEENSALNFFANVSKLLTVKQETKA